MKEVGQVTQFSILAQDDKKPNNSSFENELIVSVDIDTHSLQ